MPNVTVTAADTATAMDEIWDQLGPDAMIVSTKKQHGKIVMEATTEAVSQTSRTSMGQHNWLWHIIHQSND